jgi:hypothetical protein
MLGEFAPMNPLVVASLAVGFLTVAAVISPSSAQGTGDEWLKRCSDDDFACATYLAGVNDLHNLPEVPKMYCIGKSGATVVQMRQVVLKYLRDNPNKTHLSFISLVLDAMREAFPCRKSN